MTRKANYVIVAWITLMLKKYEVTESFSLKEILFTREEIIAEAEKYVPADKAITNMDFDNLVFGKGTGSNKCFAPGNAGTLQEYVFLMVFEEDTIETYIDIMRRTSMDFLQSYTESGIRRTFDQYMTFIRSFEWPVQREYPDMIARDALWLAAAALTYNDWVRNAQTDEHGNYCYRQRTIAAAAVSFNHENSLDTCRSMVGTDCTCGRSSQGYTYFTAENQLRRLTRVGEQTDSIPNLSDDYEVMTIDGMKTAGFLKNFVRTEYAGYPEVSENPLAVETPIEEQQDHAVRLDTQALFRAVLERSRMEILPRTVSVNQYYRDPYIAQYAKRRAHGKCQLCGMDAPFINNDGEPYLEAHHIQWLSEGGKDTLDNVVALCPNCHRKMHLLNLQEDREQLERIAEKYFAFQLVSDF